MKKVYMPTRESLNTHPIPEWFDNAKFGVFIHWGLFSVPGFAPLGNLYESIQKDYLRFMQVYPYAEGYWNAIKDPTSDSAKYHHEKYGDMPYQGFKEMFLEGLKQWNPDSWAKAFKNAGAEYVVLVTKHHDGFCLWPTEVNNRHEKNWFSKRDIVGELSEAVRKQGIRFGVYYSGGVDWTFKRRISKSPTDYIYSTPCGSYPSYAYNQIRELIDRYHPDILWNDINWTTGPKRLFKLFSYYYNNVPDGVINDRWKFPKWLMGFKPIRAYIDHRFVKSMKAQKPLEQKPEKPIPHCDFITKEYLVNNEIIEKKWESTRGMGGSFGYNRMEKEDNYATVEQLLKEFIDAVSKNGNMLLNVGPRGEDAQIPEEQLRRLSKIGEWIKVNGEAIYGTSPWSQAEAATEGGESIRFTKKNNDLFVFILGHYSGTQIRIKDVLLKDGAHLLYDNSPVNVEQDGNDTVLQFARRLENVMTPVICIKEK